MQLLPSFSENADCPERQDDEGGKAEGKRKVEMSDFPEGRRVGARDGHCLDAAEETPDIIRYEGRVHMIHPAFSG
jgi:hypothetical protein